MTTMDATVALVQRSPADSPSPFTRRALARLREKYAPASSANTPAAPTALPESENSAPSAPSPTTDSGLRTSDHVPTSHISEPETQAPKPETRAPQLSRPQILDATEACLLELGYDGTTIRRIAAHLNCAVGTIYRYFSDKRSLLDAVTQRRFEPVADLAEQGAPLSQTAELYCELATAEPQQYRLMYWLASADNRAAARTPAVITRLITAWSNQLGNLPAAQNHWAQLHGHLMLGITPNLTPTTATAIASEEHPFTSTREDVTLL